MLRVPNEMHNVVEDFKKKPLHSTLQYEGGNTNGSEHTQRGSSLLRSASGRRSSAGRLGGRTRLGSSTSISRLTLALTDRNSSRDSGRGTVDSSGDVSANDRSRTRLGRR
jgi:hypothetical protein